MELLGKRIVCRGICFDFAARIYFCTKPLDKVFRLEELPENSDHLRLGFRSFETILKEYSHAGQFDMVLQYLERMLNEGQEPGKYLYSYLISDAIKQQNRVFAVELLGKYHKVHVDNDPHPYTPILQNLIENKLLEDAQKLWASMEDRNIQMDEMTYSFMIRGFIESQEYDKALQYIQNMLAKRIQPGMRTIKSWMSRCISSPDLQHITKLWKLMKENNIKLDTDAYNMILKAHIQQKHVFSNRLNSIFNEMHENNVPLNTTTYQYLIKIFSRKLNVKKANRLYQELQNNKIPIDGVIFTDMVNMFTNTGDIENAEMLIIETDRHAFGDKFWLIAFSSVTHHHAKLGNYRRVQNLLEKLHYMGIQKDSVMMIGIITGLASSGMDEIASEVFSNSRSMFDKEQTGVIYNSLAKCYADKGQTADCVMAIEALGYLPAPVHLPTYISLFLCHLNSHDVPQAEDLSKFILSEKTPKVRDCLFVVDHLILLGEHKLCRLWIDYMCDQNYFPSEWYAEDKKSKKIISKNSKRKLGSIK